MGIFKISVYDRNWRLIHVDFHQFSDWEQANLRAEADCDWLGGAHYEAIRIR